MLSFISLFALFAPTIFAAGAPYISPLQGGGSMLDNATSVVGGLGEPLNVIISAASSPGSTHQLWLSLLLPGYRIVHLLPPLFSPMTQTAADHPVRVVNSSQECFNQHEGGYQQANLGDGKGWVNQIVEYRETFGDIILGTCIQSLVGGNHFRMWRQATTGALFLAVSHEQDLSKHHDISPDGYNQGRELLVASALKNDVKFFFKKYTTSVEYVPLSQAGTNGVNHGVSVDGMVAVLTVKATRSLN